MGHRRVHRAPGAKDDSRAILQAEKMPGVGLGWSEIGSKHDNVVVTDTLPQRLLTQRDITPIGHHHNRTTALGEMGSSDREEVVVPGWNTVSHAIAKVPHDSTTGLRQRLPVRSTQSVRTLRRGRWLEGGARS